MVNSVEQQIIDGVDRNGWFAVSYVPRVESDDPEEWFTYTIGLTKTAGWPEIICFGLDEERSVGMLRDTIAECWDRAIRPAAGVELTKVLQDRPARLKQIDGLPPSYFAMADWYAEHTNSPRLDERLQLVWPDRNGRFPDDPDCDPDVRERQTPKAGK
ncbi:MAG TPA: DUF4262 domain-containing protein [Sphingomicrobium sp.]|nr:DUF4262 domain-containing protein [Sphingomicrobium sp.]